jgi:class 3 adenylate cyclase
VVGAERYQFDIWGDTVNVAARMTGRGSPGTVAVTEDVWKMIESQFVGVSLDRQEIKGKGGIIVYEIRSIR